MRHLKSILGIAWALLLMIIFITYLISPTEAKSNRDSITLTGADAVVEIEFPDALQPIKISTRFLVKYADQIVYTRLSPLNSTLQSWLVALEDRIRLRYVEKNEEHALEFPIGLVPTLTPTPTSTPTNTPTMTPTNTPTTAFVPTPTPTPIPMDEWYQFLPLSMRNQSN